MLKNRTINSLKQNKKKHCKHMYVFNVLNYNSLIEDTNTCFAVNAYELSP